MRKYSGILKQNVMSLLNGYFKMMIPVSRAEDAADTPVPSDDKSSNPSPAPAKVSTPVETQINYEDLIAKARKEEKDKLYGQITDLQTKLKAMTKSNNENMLKAADVEGQLEKMRNNNAESEEVTNLRKQLADVQKEFENYKQSTPTEEALREKIEAEYEVKLYKIEQLGSDALKKEILPVFLDSITGNTKEEIDKAIELAKEKTKQAREQMGMTEPVATAAPQRESVPRAVSPNDPLKNGFGSGTDLNYIANLPADSPEYAEWRKKMGLK